MFRNLKNLSHVPQSMLADSNVVKMSVPSQLTQPYKQEASKWRIWKRWLQLGAVVVSGSVSVASWADVTLNDLSSSSSSSNGTCNRVTLNGLASGGNATADFSGLCSHFDNPVNNGNDFSLWLPDADRPASTAANVAKVLIYNSAGDETSVTGLTCPGATVGGIGTSFGTIALADGASCTLHVYWENGGSPISLTGVTLSRSGDNYSSSGGLIKGEDAGGTAEPMVSSPVSASVKSNIALALAFIGVMLIAAFKLRKARKT